MKETKPAAQGDARTAAIRGACRRQMKAAAVPNTIPLVEDTQSCQTTYFK